MGWFGRRRALRARIGGLLGLALACGLAVYAASRAGAPANSARASGDGAGAPAEAIVEGGDAPLAAAVPPASPRETAEPGRERAAAPAPPERRDEPTSLDDASPAIVAARLDEAIRRARAERGVRISEGLVERVIEAGSVRVIVAQTRSQPALEPRLAGTRHGAPRPFAHVPFVALEVGPQALLELTRAADVLGIEEDRPHRPGLAQSVPLIAADASTAAGFDGSDRVIAILDTGVDTAHPVFAGRIVDEACFSLNGDCPGGGTRELGPGTGRPCTFSCGHGTLVAGIALGLDPAGVRTGVAPDAGLVSIMVYSDDAGEPIAYTSDIIAGLEHVYDLRSFHAFAAVNLSLGGDPFRSTAECDAANGARKAVIDLLRGAGIPTIASSGNDGFTDLITEPACISTAISVGATTKGDVVTGFSNSADFLLLLAPGSLIESSRAGGGFATASGTSIAAPHVSGAWAAILEAVPGKNVSEVLFALETGGVPRVDPRNGVSTPRVDVAGAIEVLDAGIEIEDPTAAGAPAGPGGGSACGLLGAEALFVVVFARALAARASRRRAFQRSTSAPLRSHQTPSNTSTAGPSR